VLRLSEYEYKKLPKIHNTGKYSAVRKDNSKTKVFKKIQTVSKIPRSNPDLLFIGDFGIIVKIHGKHRGDKDNIKKAILDALQGYAYGNDRDCEYGAGFRRRKTY